LWAGTTLVIRGTNLSNAPPEQTLMYQLLVSAPLLGLASWWSGEAWPERASELAWGALAFQTVIVTFASYLLWFWLMRHYPATQISSFTLLTPIFGLAAGVGLLGEPLTWRLVMALVARWSAGARGRPDSAARLSPGRRIARAAWLDCRHFMIPRRFA
jgi:drug/metabolite transporter (DMT)-like permease